MGFTVTTGIISFAVVITVGIESKSWSLMFCGLKAETQHKSLEDLRATEPRDSTLNVGRYEVEL